MGEVVHLRDYQTLEERMGRWRRDADRLMEESGITEVVKCPIIIPHYHDTAPSEWSPPDGSAS